VHGTGVAEGADGADGVGGGASRGNVSETPAVLTLCVPIRGVCAFDRPRAGEKAYGRAHCWDVAGVDGDDNGGGSLPYPGLGVRVEVSGGEDAYVLGVEDRLRKAGAKFIRVFGEEGNGEGVDGKLGFVGGEAEGQPGRISHWDGGGHPHTPYISCQQLLVGWTATVLTELWERSDEPHITRKHTTPQPYRAVAPYSRRGRRRVLGISPASHKRFKPLLRRSEPVSWHTKRPCKPLSAPQYWDNFPIGAQISLSVKVV